VFLAVCFYPLVAFLHHLGYLAFLHNTINHQNQRLLIGVWQIVGLLAQPVWLVVLEFDFLAGRYTTNQLIKCDL